MTIPPCAAAGRERRPLDMTAEGEDERAGPIPSRAPGGDPPQRGQPGKTGPADAAAGTTVAHKGFNPRRPCCRHTSSGPTAGASVETPPPVFPAVGAEA